MSEKISPSHNKRHPKSVSRKISANNISWTMSQTRRSKEKKERHEPSDGTRGAIWFLFQAITNEWNNPRSELRQTTRASIDNKTKSISSENRISKT